MGLSLSKIWELSEKSTSGEAELKWSVTCVAWGLHLQCAHEWIGMPLHKRSRKTQNVGVLPLEEWSVQTLGQRFTVGFGSLNFLSRPCWCAM